MRWTSRLAVSVTPLAAATGAPDTGAGQLKRSAALSVLMTPTEEEELRMLYQITVSDLSYFKSQQWNVTYYALLVEAGFVGVGQLLGQDLTVVDRAVLGTLAVVSAISALNVIGKLQRSISVRHSRLDSVRGTMSQAFHRAWSAVHKAEEKVPNVFLLRGGIVITTLLTLWLILCRLGAA